jgi:hypothetical protein
VVRALIPRKVAYSRSRGLEQFANQPDGFGQRACAEAEGALDQTCRAKDVAREVDAT